MSIHRVQCTICKAIDPPPTSDADKPEAWIVCSLCRIERGVTTLEAAQAKREAWRAEAKLREIAGDK